MNSEFRPAGVVTQFYDELEKLSLNSFDVLAWQTDAKGNRNTHHCVVSNYLAKENITTIHLSSATDFDFWPQSDVFLYSESMGILFKGKIETQQNKKLKLIARENVYLKEHRAIHRVSFQYTKVLVDLTFEGKLQFKNAKLRDISEHGFSVFVTPAMAKGFVKGMEINLDKIHGIEMPVKLAGQIIHQTKGESVKGGHKDSYLVGVKFHEPSKLIKKVVSVMEATSL